MNSNLGKQIDRRWEKGRLDRKIVRLMKTND